MKTGLHNILFEKSIIVGKATRLAANLRAQEIIEPASRIRYMGFEMGIEPASMRHEIIPYLEDLGYIEVRQGPSGKPERIEENVPRLGTLLEKSTSKWHELEPSPSDFAGVELLKSLSSHPQLQENVQHKLEDSLGDDCSPTLSCLEAGGLVDRYKLQHQNEVLYSPIVWNMQAESAMKFYSHLDSEERDELNLLTTRLREYPGMPKQDLKVRNDLLGQSIQSGFLEVGSTQTPNARKDFLFLPDSRMKISEEGVQRGDLFDKVKAILSAVRHGERFAPKWRIKYPVALLNTLLDRGYLKPYSRARDQYSIPEIKGMVRFRKARGMWETHLIESKENEQAIAAARDIISTGSAVTDKLVEKNARSLLVPGTFIDSIRNRSLHKRAALVDETAFKAFLEGLRGERVDY